MRRPAAILVSFVIVTMLVFVPAARAADTVAHHALSVTLDPATHRLSVTDTVTWPGLTGHAPQTFLLNARLRITKADPAVEEAPRGDVDGPFGPGTAARTPLKRYRLKGQAASVTLTYDGPMDFPLSDPKEEYTRGFRDTIGLVGPEGVYLAASSFWHPRFGAELVTFTITAKAPDGWHLISQGNGTSRDASGTATWDSAGTMDEIYLVGGPLRVYKDSAGAAETLVYLHDDDPSLASKYLGATAQYLEMYRGLIGPYPYGKFALVENFWETGYGMPTFTLLGSQIIRFPFILTSSYPHEILHNWWGNSVFVDYDSGNWCEGLTAYMADHLIQEQRGTGDEYRRSTLQKYRDYVKTGRDFPLSEFRGRDSAATEAVGYGKSLMGFHMVRRAIGDEAFRATVGRFAREFKGRRATFRDFQKVAETVSGTPLGWIFDDLITRAGSPTLEVKAGPGSVRQDGGRFIVDGLLRQSQAGAPFTLDVPIVVQTERGVTTTNVRLEKTEAPFSIAVDAAPVMLAVDPRFDVFRRLDPRETPPSIGQIFGEPRILALLPSAAPAAEQEAWRALFKGWQSDSHIIDIQLDSAVATLPKDKAVWIAGAANRHATLVLGSLPGMKTDGTTVEIDGEKMPLAGHSLVAVSRHPGNQEKAIGYLAVAPAAAFPGLGRKLPHYGKYSYLGFEGDEPANIIKGQWQQSDSPLQIDLRGTERRPARIAPRPADTRKALADLPPVFSQQAMRDHVAFLAAPALKGRGLGSPGLEEAAKYIAGKFKAAGLQPGGDNGTYFQRFTVDKGEDGQPHEVTNVVALLRGSRADWRDQSAMLVAHYDHLGLGWPDVHKGDEGKVHPGADDNASGVAVMLELARSMAAGAPPPRSIVFAAFAGEEAGRLGSKFYVAHPVLPLDKTWGVINLDTVGRLGTQKLTVLGTGTATEWQHIFRGAGFVTGVESRNVAESIESSDQVSFIEKGVPAVQIFTAAHADYHRPSDTPDTIDAAGLVKVAAFVKEGIVYLGERPEPMTNTITPASAAPPAPASAGGAAPARRASIGTVPDFAFPGPGVKVSGTVPGSPAEKAGIKEGDVVTRIDGKNVANLQEYSNILRGLSPGQVVTIVIARGSETLTLDIALGER
jgi:aminopeptidase N